MKKPRGQPRLFCYGLVIVTSTIASLEIYRKETAISMSGYIKILRDSQELFLHDKQVFDFMMLVSYRARWRESKINANGTKLGEAFIGRDDVKKIFGWGERVYRNVKKRVEQKYRLATCKGTNKGTIVKVLDNIFCDLNLNNHDEQKVEQKVEQNRDTKDEHETSKRRATGHLTKNKKEEIKEPTIPLPPKREDAASPLEGEEFKKSKGKRKEGKVYQGEISSEAERLHDIAKKNKCRLRIDFIQELLDDWGKENLIYAFGEADKAIRAGRDIIPRLYITRVLVNNCTPLKTKEKIINIMEA